MSKLNPVMRADRSPMNPKIWVYQLQCGHDVMKPGRKSRAKEMPCERCGRKEEPR